MQVVFSEAHALHDPQTFIRSGRLAQPAERPERAARLKAATEALGYPVRTPDDFGLEPIRAIHDDDYLEFLEEALLSWRQIDRDALEVVPNVHPNHRMSRQPEAIVARAGRFVADTSSPIGENTWEAALASANTALTGAELILAGEAHAYALCRPPGHHAYADIAGGFCFLNNVAIAAQHLRSRYDRVAIVDVDVHHGNGTQGIFYERSDVLFCSLHGDPTNFYPYYAGYADERGSGEGAGCNLNLPLAKGSGDEDFLEALDVALAAVNDYAPQVLLVSLGLDAQENDPLGILKITTDGFAAIARALAAPALPTLLVQEGGYLCDELADNLKSFLSAFEEAHRVS
jgi:acetoin utilization deacetylase AcuC-like enzyme